MKSPVSISKATGLLIVLFARDLFAAGLLETMDAEVSSLYEKSKDAIIRVHAKSQPLYGMPARTGTGFFIDDHGRFVTSATLVENAQTCWIDWDGQRVSARVVGTDPNTNLALLEVETGQPTPVLKVSAANDLRVGSMVIAIGFPYDLPSAPSVGFVTGLDISCGTRVFPVNFIRAGCKLRPGQGGGPMLNVRGEVVGMAVAAHADDQCYAVPIAAVNKICADLVQHGETRYSWVGLNVTERQVTNNTRSAQWHVFVQEVTSNSPAAEAGFQNRDMLLRISTNDIRHSADVLNTMFYRRCGERVSMTILRDGVTQQVSVVVGHRLEQPVTARALPSSVPTILPAFIKAPR